MKAQAGPVNRQGSCVRSGGSLKTQSEQRHWQLRLGQAETTIEAQSGLSEAKTEVRTRASGSGLVAGQSAAAGLGLRARLGGKKAK